MDNISIIISCGNIQLVALHSACDTSIIETAGSTTAMTGACHTALVVESHVLHNSITRHYNKPPPAFKLPYPVLKLQCKAAHCVQRREGLLPAVASSS
jgi:hypothetical protein